MKVRRYQRLSIIRKLADLGDDLIGLFYPRICVGCGEQHSWDQQVLCPKCLAGLHLCEFSRKRGNRLEELFYGRVRIEAATSYLYFRKHGLTQRLLHQLKYQGRQDIGSWIGRAFALELSESGRFDTFDLIIPVPLHPKKERQRGYNQVSRFGRALADRLDIPLDERIFKRNRPGRSLTGKNRIERNESLLESFSVSNPKCLRDKHILLVDDIITSGATLEACARQILDIPGARVSLASMAFTL